MGLLTWATKGINNKLKPIRKVGKYFQLIRILKGYKIRYQPEEYDDVIKQAFALIDGYDLPKGQLSPSFTLPDEARHDEFIKKFFKAASDHGYEVVRNPSSGLSETYTTFNFYKEF